MLSPADIVYFSNYIFTDNNDNLDPDSSHRRRFALVLLPQTFMFTNSLYCCVITSAMPRNFGLELLQENYQYFSRTSYACFNRTDWQPLENYKHKGKLVTSDIKEALKILYKCMSLNLSCYYDNNIRATLIREWKKLKK
jgi:hypothetical protein